MFSVTSWRSARLLSTLTGRDIVSASDLLTQGQLTAVVKGDEGVLIPNDDELYHQLQAQAVSTLTTQNGLYYLNPRNEVNAVEDEDWLTLHRRYGHCGDEALSKWIERKIIRGGVQCTGCAWGKMVARIIGRNQEKDTHCRLFTQARLVLGQQASVDGTIFHQ
eukprot:TRINITY_DN9044_c0_g2_i2.p1 TRINITY_DN9044_c0_g2~~TRINITY_DN9044_c0_g2_i2.p1  ORF type:complete len:163 (+),score=22.13 TRINITY_DN9044_c0_g2_i2:14-502(+)